MECIQEQETHCGLSNSKSFENHTLPLTISSILKQQKERKRKKLTFYCYKCSKEGHITRNCKTLVKEQQMGEYNALLEKREQRLLAIVKNQSGCGHSKQSTLREQLTKVGSDTLVMINDSGESEHIRAHNLLFKTLEEVEVVTIELAEGDNVSSRHRGLVRGETGSFLLKLR